MKEIKRNFTRRIYRQNKQCSHTRYAGQKKIEERRNVEEYYYVMKEIAARGKIEAEALMKYVIDGISEDAEHRARSYCTELKS